MLIQLKFEGLELARCTCMQKTTDTLRSIEGQQLLTLTRCGKTCLATTTLRHRTNRHGSTTRQNITVPPLKSSGSHAKGTKAIRVGCLFTAVGRYVCVCVALCVLCVNCVGWCGDYAMARSVRCEEGMPQAHVQLADPMTYSG